MEDIINMLNKKFCGECLLITAQCKVLECLEMTIYYTIKGQVKMSMYEFIDKLLTELQSDMNGL